MKTFSLYILLFLTTFAFAQKSDRTYLRRDHNKGTTYAYGITEITIHSDSTYTWKSWNLTNKKEWKTYKEYEPAISTGKITRNGKYYILTEYRNGNKTDVCWTVKINDRRLNFYYPNKNEKLKISAKYKRI